MCNVHGNQQGGGRDHDELQRPQSDVRDGEEMVVADAVAAGLLGVADEVCFLIAPHALRRHHQNHDPENEEDRQPNPPNTGGMPVHTADHGIKRRPVHFWFQIWETEKKSTVIRKHTHTTSV